MISRLIGAVYVIEQDMCLEINISATNPFSVESSTDFTVVGGIVRQRDAIVEVRYGGLFAMSACYDGRYSTP